MTKPESQSEPRKPRVGPPTMVLLAALLTGLLTLLAAACGSDDPQLTAGEINLEDEDSSIGGVGAITDNTGGADADQSNVGEPAQADDDADSNGSSDGSLGGELFGDGNSNSDSTAGNAGSGAAGTDKALAEDDGAAPDVPTPAPTPIPKVIDTPLDGPFGGGSYSNARFEVVGVTLTNRPLNSFGMEDDFTFEWSEPGESDARGLLVELQITNDDRNDGLRLRFDSLGLIIDGDRPTPAIGVGNSTPGMVEQFAATNVVVGFALPAGAADTLDSSTLTITYEDDSVPMQFPVFADGPSDDGYPIALELPEPFQYIEGNCEVTIDVNVEEATLGLDYPADLVQNNLAASVDGRADAGTRWLVFKGFTESGTGDCNFSMGNINSENFRLLVDGRPQSPSVSPNVIFQPNEIIDFTLGWQIPADAVEVIFIGTGRGGTTAEVTIDLPTIPTVPGE